MAAPAADDDDHRAALPREEDDGEEEEGSEEEVESDDEEEEEGEGYDWSEEDDPEAASLAGICDPDAGSDDDPTFDPAADGDLEVDAVLRSRMARMSLSSARKDRFGSGAHLPSLPPLPHWWMILGGFVQFLRSEIGNRDLVCEFGLVLRLRESRLFFFPKGVDLGFGFCTSFAIFRKGSRMPKMGKEEMDLLAMVDKLMHGQFFLRLPLCDCDISNNVMQTGNREGLKFCLLVWSCEECDMRGKKTT